MAGSAELGHALVDALVAVEREVFGGELFFGFGEGMVFEEDGAEDHLFGGDVGWEAGVGTEGLGVTGGGGHGFQFTKKLGWAVCGYSEGIVRNGQVGAGKFGLRLAGYHGL